MIDDNEILANRRLIIDYLKNPKLRKAKGWLRNGVGGRCCLGHMCDALGIVPIKDDEGWNYGYGISDSFEYYSMPLSIVNKLGMFDCAGGFRTRDLFGYSFTYEDNTYRSLAHLNDESNITPQKIGELLEEMILGGEKTPWKKIKSISC